MSRSHSQIDSQPEQQSLSERAQRVLPAGTFGNYDGSMIVAKGLGSRVWDSKGNEYVDYLIGSGPMLVGHCHPEVVEAVNEQMNLGQTFFANNPEGIALAEELVRSVPCAEQVRYVSSGGEADMYAMRLARAYTGKTKIIKFEGGYHGMSGDALMSLFPKAAANFPHAVPDSAGIPRDVQSNVLVAPYNDTDFVGKLMEQHADDIAAVIVEPLQRIVPPVPGFLEALREATTRLGIVLIFDEVVTGYRLAYGGAQVRYDVVPDLCTLGKVIGGGFALAAVVGCEPIMRHFDKSRIGDEGFTLQIGTLSGNPVASRAGLKTLEILAREGSYEQITRNGTVIMEAISQELGKKGLAFEVVGDPVLFDVVFIDRPVRNYRDTIEQNNAHHQQFNHALRERGILKSATKFYSSLSLADADLDQTVEAIKYAAQSI